MAKDPAFLFYASDFLCGVSDLTMEERGQYITLLCLQQQKGHLSRKIIGLSLGFDWDNASQDLKKKFIEDESGLFYNLRLEEELIKRSKFTEKQRDNGKKGGRPKNPTETQTKPKQNPKDNPNETLLENRNRDINETENIDENERGGTEEKTIFHQTFESFRKSYPGTKRGFDIEFKTLQKHSDWKNVVLKLLPALGQQQKWREQAVKHGAFTPGWPMLQTWLSQRRWEEELNFDFSSITDGRRNNTTAGRAAEKRESLAELERAAVECLFGSQGKNH